MATYKEPKWSFRFYRNFFTWKPLFLRNKELLWKDKFNSPRHELSPYVRVEWLWFGFIARQGDDDQHWEQWLWVHKYNDGDVEKAKNNWGWVDVETKKSTWKEYVN